MRFQHYLLLNLIFFIACDNSNNDPIPADESLIIGKWKLTRAFISDGGPQYWVDVENGEEIQFFENGTFVSDKFTECTTGDFSILQNELVLDYSCNEFNPISENKDGFITYELVLYSN